MNESPFIDVHSHNNDEVEHIKVVAYDPSTPYLLGNGYYSIGVHPWNAASCPTHGLEAFLDNCSTLCLAVGEIGLDKRCSVPFSIQKEAFIKQLDIARKLGKPAIIHCVKAYPEMVQIAKQYSDIQLIFHAFWGSPQIVDLLSSNSNSYFSFGIRELKRQHCDSLLRLIPKNRLFFETDEASQGIEICYTIAANYLNINPQSLAIQVKHNFDKVFKIDE